MSSTTLLDMRAAYMVTDWFFFFNDTATTEIYTLSLHDALPIFAARLPDAHERRARVVHDGAHVREVQVDETGDRDEVGEDRKSTRLNSSHANISYAVFCLKKKRPTSRRQW